MSDLAENRGGEASPIDERTSLAHTRPQHDHVALSFGDASEREIDVAYIVNKYLPVCLPLPLRIDDTIGVPGGRPL